jgi:predicted phosphodiesterase
MRFVVISDIQGNLPALQAVLEAVENEENVERVICAGDIVGLGAYPNEVLDLLRERNIAAIKGNYDDAVAWDGTGSGMDFPTVAEEQSDASAVGWTRSQLTEENVAYLRALPRDLRLEHGARIKVRKDALDDRTSEYRRTFFVRALFGGLATSRAPVSNLKSIVVVHGSPRANNEFVRESTAASILKTIAENSQGDVVISGHARESFSRELDRTTFIGAGPVDSTLVGGVDAEYVVVDVVGSVKVEFRSAPYDVESYRRDLERAGLPRPANPMLRFIGSPRRS